jgi:hypothetical protein
LFSHTSSRSPLLLLQCQWPSSLTASFRCSTELLQFTPLLVYFYPLIHCSSLLIASLFWLLLPFIPHTCVRFFSRPCTCCFTTE